MAQITYNDFEKINIHVGKIVNVEDFAKAKKPAYRLWTDFGYLGIKKSSAQITTLYDKDELIGRLIFLGGNELTSTADCQFPVGSTLVRDCFGWW